MTSVVQGQELSCARVLDTSGKDGALQSVSAIEAQTVGQVEQSRSHVWRAAESAQAFVVTRGSCRA